MLICTRGGGGDAIDALVGILSNLNNKDFFLEKHALAGLGKIGGQEVVDALESAAKDQDRSIREKIVIALGKHSIPESYNALTVALFDSDPYTQRRAINSISGYHSNDKCVGDEKTIYILEPIVSGYEKRDSQTSQFAKEAIENIRRIKNISQGEWTSREGNREKEGKRSQGFSK
ncbi:MAG: HEAT repeat domain-containing protein [Pseudomonadota bacterium]